MSVTINDRRATMEEEKQLAIEMWEFVRVCQIDLGTGCSSDTLKRKFCNMKLKCGISIDWLDNCYLCHYAEFCTNCPLLKNTKVNCSNELSPFDITMHPHDYLYYQIDAAISKIIKAIKEF